VFFSGRLKIVEAKRLGATTTPLSTGANLLTKQPTRANQSQPEPTRANRFCAEQRLALVGSGGPFLCSKKNLSRVQK